MTTNRRVLLVRHPDGEPTDDCFATDEVPVPDLADGEALVAVRHLSVDPAQRMWMNPGGVYNVGAQLGAPMMSLGFGEVVASRSELYPVGSAVTGMVGWQQY